MNTLASDLLQLLHDRSNTGRTNTTVRQRGGLRNPATRNTSRATFRFRQRGAHLTYKGHIPFDRITSMLTGEISKVQGHCQSLKWFSFVHERGQPDGSQDERYDHTHVAWEWEKAIDRSNARIFDITHNEEAVHPHIQLFTNSAHKQLIYDDYHKKDPVELTQSEEGPEASLSFIEQLVRAPTLFAACEIAGVEIKSVNDIKLLREDKPLPEEYSHLFPAANWTLIAPFTRCAYLWGPTGTGKTQWAVHQFNKPLLVSTRDGLRHFRRDLHDGIVFDDIDFSTWEREELIHLFDWDNERTIRCRYNDAVIPRFTKKIVTSNRPFETNFHMDVDIGAIRRRFDRVVHVTGPTFTELPPTLEVPPSPQADVPTTAPTVHDEPPPRSPSSEIDLFAHTLPSPSPIYCPSDDDCEVDEDTARDWLESIHADEIDIYERTHFGEFMANKL